MDWLLYYNPLFVPTSTNFSEYAHISSNLDLKSFSDNPHFFLVFYNW